MSRIREIVRRREKCFPPSLSVDKYSTDNDMLTALDVLANALETIAEELKKLNIPKHINN